jgi:ABC-type transport system involved in cytochrome c biogenesis ATPase subunit
MRLREIRTHKLFGLFDHVIPLNMDERITIMHGPNGYGKTAILRMIDAVFRRSYGALRELPFEILDLEFADAQTLSVRKRLTRTESNDEGEQLAFDFGRRRTYELQSFAARFLRDSDSGLSLRMLEERISGLDRVSPSQWRFRPTGELLDLDDVLERFADSLSARHMLRELKEVPPWLMELTDSLDVHFIRANRLERTERVMRRGEPGIELTFVVDKFARELAEHIQATLAQYAELSQSLDRSFPRRLVTTAPGPSTSLPSSRIREKLTEIEEKRRRLTDAGLIDKEEQSHFEIPPGTGIESEKIDVLSVYIADVEKKLGVFDELFRKIELFKGILNRRFLFKTASVDKTWGIKFETPDGSPLASSSLSSGEQHEVVLLYQLLFKVQPDSLILIDEPELSLHIAWQEHFLPDLAKITELSNFDVLIATHSPQIIGNRWDLTVELRGPSECGSTSQQMPLPMR